MTSSRAQGVDDATESILYIVRVEETKLVELILSDKQNEEFYVLSVCTKLHVYSK